MMQPARSASARGALLGLLLGYTAICNAASGGLRHDPFAPPPGKAAVAPASSAATPRAAAEGPPPADGPPPQLADLRGVLLAGKGSVANVGGSIVPLGASIDGWQLIQVGDGTALFAKAGKRLLLTMNNAGPQNK